MFNLIHLKETSSTMDFIKNYSNNTAIISDIQTKGRGKDNRVWDSDDKNNLFCSIKINDKNNFAYKYVFLTGFCLVKTLIYFFPNINLNLKWPNDLLLNNQKIAGCLVENDIKNKSVIIGFGLNIDTFPNNTLFPSTSLKNESFIIKKLDFLNKFFHFFDELNNVDFSLIREGWLHYAYNLNKIIYVKINNKEIKGLFKNLDLAGNLILQINDNENLEINIGDIF